MTFLEILKGIRSHSTYFVLFFFRQKNNILTIYISHNLDVKIFSKRLLLQNVVVRNNHKKKTTAID